MTALAATALLVAGCAAADSGKRPPRPTHFRHHAFSAECGNTRSCKVLYANRFQVEELEGGPVSPLREGVIKIARNGHIAIRNFPGPAIVSWQSLDGERHEAEIDIGSIFRDRVVIHAEPVEDVEDDSVNGEPLILLVVDDRTVQVYMQSMVYLRKATGERDESYKARHDSVLAYSKTY
ncbi:hypothetical protein [Luteibacter aegosomatissinici]|uniref:hypothetical protein n=1 Tax=Luteibacter aegosomatissinici TaxID=2911539 RepID=UPI001FF81493|nr:hypothetical protein [Luteibacter aegosomatissinici]UPG93608.1 hypothetical protein L2Y97_17435 [Luteibacter aegosomatissinici]